MARKAVRGHPCILRGIVCAVGESFDRHVWTFVGGFPRVNHRRTIKSVPARTPQADVLSKDLALRGFRFVGPTIMYAFMQATGLVNDHLTHCPRWAAVQETQAGTARRIR